MRDLRAQLQSTFGDAYTLERELGGGGMSRGRADQYVDNWSALIVTAMFAACGDHEIARSRLVSLHAREATEYVWPVGFAVAYGYLGDFDRAVEYLERAYEDRAGWVTFLATASVFDPLRVDPRFAALVAKVGAPVTGPRA